jgi:hypothetical protein
MGRISWEALQGGRTPIDDDDIRQGSSAVPASASSLPCTSSLPEAAARRKRRRRIDVPAGASRALHQPFHECTISWFLYLFCSSRSSRPCRKRRTTQEFACKALPPSCCCSCSLYFFFCNNNRSRTAWARFFFFITPAQMELESSFRHWVDDDYTQIHEKATDHEEAGFSNSCRICVELCPNRRTAAAAAAAGATTTSCSSSRV